MFKVSKCGSLNYILSTGLGAYDFAVHAFGTRTSGSEADIGTVFHLPAESVFTGRQVHGDTILVLDGSTENRQQAVLCDGLVTDRRGIALGIRTADCVPVLILDPVKKAIGAVHAGWKGTALEITAKAVDAFVEAFRSDPGDLRAAVGPCIGSCCYEVDEPVYRAMKDLPWADSVFAEGASDGRWMLDLGKSNCLQLIEKGVSGRNISRISLCTRCRRDLFFSYRGEGARAGRQLNFIMLR